ncbi:MAG TPA: ABC transporter permease [Granulicella sp.]
MKNIRNSWGISISALKKNKLQTALTMTGMAIGVATVLTMIALGSGAQTAIQDQVRAAGMNLIIVQAGNWSRGADSGAGSGMSEYRPETEKPNYVPAAYLYRENARPSLMTATYYPRQGARFLRVQGDSDTSAVGNGAGGNLPVVHVGRPGDLKSGLGAATTLTADDVEAIRKVKGVQYASAGLHDEVAIELNGNRIVTTMHGDETVLPKIRRVWSLTHGRFYNKEEEKNASNVVVLGQFVSEKFFGKENPVGKTVNLKGQDFKVIGELGSSSWMVQPSQGDDQFDAVYIPVASMQHLLKQNYLGNVTISTVSTGEVGRVVSTITDLLRKRHGIDDQTPDDFTVRSESHKSMAHSLRPDVANAVMSNAAGLEKITLDQIGRTLDQASSTMSALLTSIAAVSLVVGGIGVMNIMLLSVSQRTREIGIRRAVGAQSQEVLTQFLLEATALSLIGGLIGIIVGCLISAVIAHMAQWSTTISVPAVLISFGISAGIGIFFGYYPAREASRILPIQALKYE